MVPCEPERRVPSPVSAEKLPALAVVVLPVMVYPRVVYLLVPFLKQTNEREIRNVVEEEELLAVEILVVDVVEVLLLVAQTAEDRLLVVTFPADVQTRTGVVVHAAVLVVYVVGQKHYSQRTRQIDTTVVEENREERRSLRSLFDLNLAKNP